MMCFSETKDEVIREGKPSLALPPKGSEMGFQGGQALSGPPVEVLPGSGRFGGA
jgi:hypothetical protein